MDIDTDRRLTELEIKLSFQEDLIDRLDQVIVRQQQQIDALTHQLRQMHERLERADTGQPRSLRDELPPHY